MQQSGGIEAEPPKSKKRRVKKGACNPPRKPTSEIFPPEDWPKNFTKEQVDSLTPLEVIAIIQNKLKKDKVMGKKESLPGKM